MFEEFMDLTPEEPKSNEPKRKPEEKAFCQPKHTLINPTYRKDEAIRLLKDNVHKELWAMRMLEALPMGTRGGSSRKEREAIRYDTPPDIVHNSRDWAQYAWLCTFGKATGDVFMSGKYLEYMKAFDDGKPKPRKQIEITDLIMKKDIENE